MSHTLLSAGAGRLSLWLGGATLALGTFVRITRELMEGDDRERTGKKPQGATGTDE
jgi:hypothetical protein